MQTYKLLAMLLDYPGSEIVGDLRAAVSEQGGAGVWCARWTPTRCSPRLSTGASPVSSTGCSLRTRPSSKAVSSRPSDLTPEHSLHLTHHVFGDDKNRGPALIDLSEFYKSLRSAARRARDPRTTCR